MRNTNKSAFQVIDDEEETYDVVYRVEAAKDFLLREFQELKENAPETPTILNNGKTPTSALSLEQDIFSSDRFISSPLISSITSTDSQKKSVKLSTIQRESQRSSQLYYQSLSQSSDSQVEVIEDEDDFDDFFSSQPIKKKPKQKSWSQSIRTASHKKNIIEEDIDEFSDNEDDFLSLHHKTQKPRHGELQIAIVDEHEELHMLKRNPFQSPPTKKAKVPKTTAKNLIRPSINLSQFAGNYHIQSRLADIQMRSPLHKVQPPQPVPRARDNDIDEIVFDDEEEEDVAVHDNYTNERTEDRPAEHEQPPQENNWLTNIRQNKILSQPPPQAKQSRSYVFKNIKASSGSYLSKFKAAVSGITANLNILSHSLPSRDSQSVRLSQVANAENIIVKIIKECEEYSLYKTICRSENQFLDVVFDKSVKEALGLCIGKKVRIYAPWVEYQGVRRIITCTFNTMDMTEQIDPNVSADLEQFEKIFVKPLLSEKEEVTTTPHQKHRASQTPIAQRRANQITSPGNASRRLRFEDEPNASNTSVQDRPIVTAAHISLDLVSNPFSADCDNLLNEYMTVKATILQQWSIEKVLNDLKRGELIDSCRSRNTILARFSDGLCLIEVPVREYKYWETVFKHGTGKAFEFSFVSYCGKKLVQSVDPLFPILKSIERDNQGYFELYLFHYTDDILCKVIRGDQTCVMDNSNVRTAEIVEDIALEKVSRIEENGRRVQISGRIVLLRDLRDTFSPHVFVIYLQNAENQVQRFFITRGTKHTRDLVMVFTICFGKKVVMDVSGELLDEWTKVDVVIEEDYQEIEGEIDRRKHIEKIFADIPTRMIMDRSSMDSDGDINMVHTITMENFQLYDIGNVDGFLTDIIEDKPKPFTSTCPECNGPKGQVDGFCRSCGCANNMRLSLQINALMTDRVHINIDHGTVEKILRRKNDRAMNLSGNETFEEAKNALLSKDKIKFLCFCYGVEIRDGIKHVYLDAVGVDRKSGKLRNIYNPAWNMID